jgi:thymidine kinase
MGSGKTLMAIQREMTLNRRKFIYAITKSSTDTRAGQQIQTRFGEVSRDIDFVTHPDDSLVELTLRTLKEKEQHMQIGGVARRLGLIIDEVNFMTETQVHEADQLVNEHGVNVYTFGIATDFLGNPFTGEQVARALADRSIELEADCYGWQDDGDCNNRASYNARLIGESYVFRGDQVAINEEGDKLSGHEPTTTYRSLCRTCYNLAKLESQQTC